LIDRILGPHDHEQLDVALVIGLPVGIEAIQNDLFRLKALRDTARETRITARGMFGEA
jgi:hypothetical protein